MQDKIARQKCIVLTEIALQFSVQFFYKNVWTQVRTAS